MRRNTRNQFIFLEKTHQEATTLLAIIKEYFTVRAKHDRALLSGEAKLAHTVVLSNIAVRLTSSIQWLEAMRTLNKYASICDLNDEKLHLYKIDENIQNDEKFYVFMPKIIIQLAHASSNIYARVGRLEAALWGDHNMQAIPNGNLPDIANVLQFKSVGDRDTPISAKG